MSGLFVWELSNSTFVSTARQGANASDSSGPSRKIFALVRGFGDIACGEPVGAYRWVCCASRRFGEFLIWEDSNT